MEPFFPTTCGPKNSPATLDRNAPAHVQERRVPLQPTPCPQFQCCWKQPQKSHHLNRKAHSHQKSPSACTTLKLGGARGGLSSKPTYITMLAPHYLSIVQSLSNRSKRQAREYFQNQATVANFNLLDVKFMKNGFSRIWK